jgi:hypothetical protein
VTSDNSVNRDFSFGRSPNPDTGCADTAILLAGWQVYSGMGTEDDDAARIGALMAITARLTEYLMVMTARKRRGDGDELLSPLVMTTLPLTNVLSLDILIDSAYFGNRPESARKGRP